MTTEKMTLTQALSELKIISNRLHYEIDAFEANVDSAITIANSTTVITIEY